MAALAATASPALAETPPTITKSFNLASVQVGDTVLVTFEISNPNATPLSGVAFTDSLPAGLSVSETTIVADECLGSTSALTGASTISLTGGQIPGSSSCSITVELATTSTGVKDNTTGPVSSAESVPGAPSNTASVTVTTAAPSISKFLSAGGVAVGGVVGMSFTLTNPAGNGPLTGVAFTDAFPAGLEVANPSQASNQCGGTLSAAPGALSVSLSGATIPDGATCDISLAVRATTAGTKNNSTSTLTSNEAPPGAASNVAVLTVITPPTFTKDFAATLLEVGETTTLSFALANPLGNPFLANVGFSDPLPPGLEVASPSGLTGDCGEGTITAPPGATTILLEAAILDAGETCNFAVDVVAKTGGTKNNTTSPLSFSFETSGDPATATAPAASDSVDVVRAPIGTASFGAQPIRPGASTSLTFKLDNPNSGTALTGVGFTDTLPAGLVVASPGGLSGSCGGGTIIAGDGSSTISLAGATLPAGGTCTFSVNVTGATDGRKENSTGPIASVEGGNGDPATATLVVAAPPVISKAFGTSFIPLGGSTTLSFAIANPNANIALGGVQFTDVLPAGLVISSGSGATSTCGGTLSASGAAVALVGGVVGAGGTCTATVNVTGTTTGLKTNVTGVVGSVEGGDGNAASAALTVAAPPSVTITTPAAGGRYSEGQTVRAAYSCAEGASGPGIQSCTGTVAAGARIDTRTAGTKSFTVTARSRDGLTTTRAVSYRVTDVDNEFSIKDLEAASDGTVRFTAKLPGAGKLDVLETAPSSAEPKGRAALKPGPGMFTFGSESLGVKKAGSLKVKVDATSRGKKLARDRRDAFRVNVYVTFTPSGGEARTLKRKVTIPR